MEERNKSTEMVSTPRTMGDLCQSSSGNHTSHGNEGDTESIVLEGEVVTEIMDILPKQTDIQGEESSKQDASSPLAATLMSDPTSRLLEVIDSRNAEMERKDDDDDDFILFKRYKVKNTDIVSLELFNNVMLHILLQNNNKTSNNNLIK